ncbi:zinc finger CCCH domain-containing protein 20-like [Musa acuminata AAA Group]|uniref:zinc finger CCCH domain-containing protein 20-like n=1 Tax=Musa acuminata AAA Group TaxID=214697 RepID=UPI0031DBF61F
MAPGERALRHPMGHAPPWPVTEHPMVHAPPWPVTEHPMAGMQQNDTLPVSDVVGLSAMQHFLLGSSADLDLAADEYACDEFRMYEFKVRRCPRGRVHDWTECPYAHSGEKARRRDPRRFQYSGSPCPDFRRGGGCRLGDACDLAHGVFETWLHPARYRTQPCKDGTACSRRVCFFAHTPEQLRIVLPPSPTSSGKIGVNIFSSPTSTLALLSSPSDGSPPLSPLGVDDVLAAMRNLQLGKVRSALPFGTRSGFASPASLESDPATRGRRAAAAVADQSAPRLLEDWGRQEEAAEPAPDLAWVSELVKD